MNLNFEIIPDQPDSIADLEVKIQGLSGRMRTLAAEMMAQAVEAGRIVAEREAPRGPILERDSGRISDSIQIERGGLERGGVGGGSAYTIYRLYASSAIAPHLRYVMEGTADQGRGLINPSRGNVLVLQKEGEIVRFRPWVHGQRANTRWWDQAHEAVQESLDSQIGRDNI
jgi:hypothetical protein